MEELFGELFGEIYTKVSEHVTFLNFLKATTYGEFIVAFGCLCWAGKLCYDIMKWKDPQEKKPLQLEHLISHNTYLEEGLDRDIFYL